MAKMQSFLIPAFTFSLTLAALILPWALPAGAAGPPRLQPLSLSAVLASTSVVAIVLLGAVRRRDLLRIANARAVLEGLGRRPLPAGRLIAMAGWSLATLYDELAWGQTLNGCAVLLRLMTRVGAGLAALAGLAIAAAGLWPAALAGLIPAPTLDAWAPFAAAIPLWLAAELSLSRHDGVSAPTHSEIRAALAGLGERLGGTGAQLGVAAMTGVEQGLDVVLPLLERRVRASRPDGATDSPASDGEELVQELHH